LEGFFRGSTMEWPLKIMTDALGWVRKRGLREG
jgi:hypothetical protein